MVRNYKTKEDVKPYNRRCTDEEMKKAMSEASTGEKSIYQAAKDNNVDRETLRRHLIKFIISFS